MFLLCPVKEATVLVTVNDMSTLPRPLKAVELSEPIGVTPELNMSEEQSFAITRVEFVRLLAVSRTTIR